jgi:hypothetical protein
MALTAAQKARKGPKKSNESEEWENRGTGDGRTVVEIAR